MYKIILILSVSLAGCSTGVVTIERPIPANMLRMCPDELPKAPDGKSATILRTSVARAAIYRDCMTNNNSLVKYLTDK